MLIVTLLVLTEKTMALLEFRVAGPMIVTELFTWIVLEPRAQVPDSVTVPPPLTADWMLPGSLPLLEQA